MDNHSCMAWLWGHKLKFPFSQFGFRIRAKSIRGENAQYGMAMSVKLREGEFKKEQVCFEDERVKISQRENIVVYRK